jgi:hypothetical protein
MANKIIDRLVEVPFPEFVKQLALVVPTVQKALDEGRAEGAPLVYCKEAVIEAKIALSMKTATDVSGTVAGKVGFAVWSASVEASYSRKYEFTAEMASSIRLTIVGVPAETVAAGGAGGG